MNLKATRTRDAFAAKLAENWNEPKPPFVELLKELTYKVVRELRRGEPAVELMSGLEVPPLKWLLEPIIPDELATIFFGPKESGKTAIALLAYFIIGIPLRDNPFHWTPKQEDYRPGVWLDWETSQDVIQRRINRLQVGMGIDFSLPMIYRRCSLPIAEDGDALFNMIAEKKAGWVFVDSLGPACGGDLNAPEPAIRFFEHLRRMHITPIVLAHSAKNATGDKSVFGSGFFENLPRSLWEVRGEKDDATGDLRIAMIDRKSNETRKRKPMGFLIQYDDPDGGITVTRQDDVVHEADSLASMVSLTDRIIFVLTQTGKMTTEAVCEALPYPDTKMPPTEAELEHWHGTIKSTLYKLAKKKRVMAFGNGAFGAVATNFGGGK